MTLPEPSHDEWMARLRLARSDNIGPATFRDLMRHCGSALAAIDALPALSARGGKKNPPRPVSLARVEAELETGTRMGATIVLLGDEAYPSMLAKLDPAPPVLTLKGHAELMRESCIAMVGARNASAAGCRIAADIAANLSSDNHVIVSGLARGIDTAAHRASLARGTIGVVAGGLDVFYPSENETLQRQMSETGLVVSEMPPGTSPKAQHFPRRNRIISGLSRGVVIVEAALRSGSLITARFALEQDRDVMAVPGSPLDPRSAGSNKLIKDGAPLVENAQDVLNVLATPGQRRFMASESTPFNWQEDGFAEEPDDTSRRIVLNALSPTPTPRDEIVRQTGLSPASVQVILLELDLAGRLQRDTGDRISLLDA